MPRQLRFVINSMPNREGLMTAGQQSTIDESSLWKAQNLTSGLDGLISKRPGVRQWGHTLKEPDPATTRSSVVGANPRSYADFLAGLSGFTVTDGSATAKLVTTTNQGTLSTAVDSGSASESYQLDWITPTKATPSADSIQWSIRFLFRGGNLPAYTGGTVANTFSFRILGTDGNSQKEFAIFSGGLYYKNNSDDTYILIPNTVSVGEGGWHLVEITFEFTISSAKGDITVNIDDTFAGTVGANTVKDVPSTGTVVLRWEVEGSGGSGKQYNTRISTLMVNDVEVGAFKAQPVVAVFPFPHITVAGTSKVALVAAAGGYIYHDTNLEGAWRPLHIKVSQFVFFNPYRQTLIWADTNGSTTSKLIQWDGKLDPTTLDDAPPVRFFSEHQLRVLAAGDKRFPLRLYYSGDRQPNKYFSPSRDNVEDQFDVLIDAGYLEVHSKKGDEIVAIFGGYYGVALIWTKRGVWKFSGSGINSYRIDPIDLDTGCVGPQAIAQVGNDVWFISKQGIHSIIATEKFGNLETAFPSFAIQDLWGQDSASSLSINTQHIERSKLDYNPQQGLVYAALPLTGEVEPQNIFVYNRNSKKWHGPWTIDGTSMASGEISAPFLEVMLHGDAIGRIGYTDVHFKADFGTAYTFSMESALLNGRSATIGGKPLPPEVIGRKKSWKTLRLFLLPRGDWDYKVTWSADDKPEDSDTRSQLKETRTKVLDKDFRLDVDVLLSPEGLIIQEHKLDQRGINLSFLIDQTGLGEDFPIQGWQVEGILGDFEAN